MLLNTVELGWVDLATEWVSVGMGLDWVALDRVQLTYLPQRQKLEEAKTGVSYLQGNKRAEVPFLSHQFSPSMSGVKGFCLFISIANGEQGGDGNWGGRESLGGRLGSTETCSRDVDVDDDDDNCRASVEVEVRRTGMHDLSLIAFFFFIHYFFAFPLVFFLFVPFLVFDVRDQRGFGV